MSHASVAAAVPVVSLKNGGVREVMEVSAYGSSYTFSASVGSNGSRVLTFVTVSVCMPPNTSLCTILCPIRFLLACAQWKRRVARAAPGPRGTLAVVPVLSALPCLSPALPPPALLLLCLPSHGNGAVPTRLSSARAVGSLLQPRGSPRMLLSCLLALLSACFSACATSFLPETGFDPCGLQPTWSVCSCNRYGPRAPCSASLLCFLVYALFAALPPVFAASARLASLCAALCCFDAPFDDL